jgi:hypothetical protein
MYAAVRDMNPIVFGFYPDLGFKAENQASIHHDEPQWTARRFRKNCSQGAKLRVVVTSSAHKTTGRNCHYALLF